MRVMLIVLVATAMLAGASRAATMTFNDLPDYEAVEGMTPDSYSENGITALVYPSGDYGALASFYSPQAAHLDDAGTVYAQRLQFTTDGFFSALSFDILGLGFNFGICDAFFENCTPRRFKNVLVEGFLKEFRVATGSFAMPFFGQWSTYRFEKTFSNIDRLVIRFTEQPSGCFDTAPCTHFDLDNVRFGAPGEGLAPVPLPAAGGLLGLGLAALIAGRRWRRSAANLTGR